MTARREIGAAKVTPFADGNTIPEHAAMNGQSFAQSGFCCVSGQHGIPSGISLDA
jgi:hypothetical protein